MLRVELIKIFKSKKSMFILTLMLLVPFIDIYLNFRYSALFDAMHFPESYPNGLPSTSIFHPTKAAFLSGSSIGHIAQMLFIWLLPLYLLLYYGGLISDEYKVNYVNIIYTKATKKSYILNKYLFAFISSFVIISLSMFLNLLSTFIIFNKGVSFGGLENSDFSEWFQFSINNPYITYITYIFIFSIISGIYSVFCVSISFIFKNKKIIYPIAFFIWILLVMCPFSLTYLFQPFIEYGPDYMFKALLLFLVITIPTIIYCYNYIGGKDEI